MKRKARGLLLLLALLLAIGLSPSALAAGSFTDVSEGAYYYDAVSWAVEHTPQITNGTGDSAFSPDVTCTRAQVVTFLWRAAGCPAPADSANPFADVPADAYYQQAVLWATEQGITKGTGDSAFSPDATCTRAQVVTFLWRDSPEYKNRTFTIQWLNYDGTVLETDENVPLGAMPEYNGETPFRPSDEKNNYKFFGWFYAVMPAEKDTSYTAQFYAIPKGTIVPGTLGGSPSVDDAFTIGRTLIEDFVPGGKTISAAIGIIIDCFKEDGTEQDQSLSDVQQQISDFRKEMDAQYTLIEAQLNSLSQDLQAVEYTLEQVVTDQTTLANKGDSFDTLLNSLQATERQINTLRNNDKLSENEKAVEIAKLIGSNDDWTTDSNLYNKYLNFLSTISGTNFPNQSGRDLLQIVYSRYKADSMFTGEAKQYASLYTDQLVYLAVYGYSICAECLKAHQEVAGFDTDDVAALDDLEKAKYYMIASNNDVVMEEIDFLSSKLLEIGFRQVSLADRLDSFYHDTTSPYVYVNRGHANVQLSDELMIKRYAYGCAIVDEEGNTIEYVLEDTMKQYDENASFGPAARTNIVNYVKSSRFRTIREYLTMLGYDMSAVPEGSWFYIKANPTYTDIPIGPDYKTTITVVSKITWTAANIDDPDCVISDEVVSDDFNFQWTPNAWFITLQP